MPTDRLSRTFAALADPTRRAMLGHLAERELTIGELATPFHMSFAGASKHVRVLENAGLVKRTVQGRTHHVPKTLRGAAVFSFRRLCGEARGAADYLAIARRYHTVILVGIPRLGPENRNEAARFVTLIDALYEHKVKLLAMADASPMDLYREGDGKFEFERTVSRLMEMQSEDYLAQGHGSA